MRLTLTSSTSGQTTDGWPPLYLSHVPKDDMLRGDGADVIKRIERLCTISKDGFGGRAGGPLVMRGWQRQLIMRLFARREDGKRRHRLALIGMPRKNGKSGLASGFALDGLLFDGRGAEVYSAAAEKEQARIVFGETKRMIAAKPDLAAELVPMKDVIEVPATNSIYRVLSAEAYSKEGLNPTRNIIDELHAHPTDELFNVLYNGTGAREEPMTLVVTTAGVMSDATGRDSICYRLYKHGVDVATGVEDDPNFFFCWWGAPEDADHSDPETWRIANPGYGDIVNPEDLEDAYKHLPENEFKIKRLNMWVSGTAAWLPAGAWDSLADPGRVVDDGTRVVLGFDGSRSRDATALVGVTIEEKPHVFVVNVWERGVNDPADWRVPAGDVLKAIREACERYRVVEVASDVALWQTELEDLAAEGLPIVRHGQRASMMVPATQRFYEAVMEGALSHDGDSRLARHVRHAIIRHTANGPQLYKESQNSPRKIDAAIASVMAYHRVFEVSGSPEIHDLAEIVERLRREEAGIPPDNADDSPVEPSPSGAVFIPLSQMPVRR